MITRKIPAWLLIISLAPIYGEAKLPKNSVPPQSASTVTSTGVRSLSGARLTGRLTADGQAF